jgi:hypothetical protein
LKFSQLGLVYYLIIIVAVAITIICWYNYFEAMSSKRHF